MDLRIVPSLRRNRHRRERRATYRLKPSGGERDTPGDKRSFGSPPPVAILNSQPVTVEELELFYGHLEKTLVEIGFLDPEKPRHLMSRLRRLYGRCGISKLEMNILRGILTETQKVARGEPHKRRED
jgi:hypothetical protein